MTVVPPAPPFAPDSIASTPEPWRQRGRRVLVIGVAVLALLGVAGVAFLVTRIGDPGGAGLAVALGLLPLPLLVWFYLWIDRFDPEPRRYVVAAFVWGAVGAVAISLGLEIWASHAFDLSDEQSATFTAPLVEESAKGVFLVATFLRARRVIGGLLDGLFYAGVVALGFAFVENIGYYAVSYLGGPDLGLSGVSGATATFVMRGVISPFAHPLFSSSLGLAVGAAVLVGSWWLRVPLVVAGWCGSVVLHGLWNGSLSYAGIGGFALVYLGLVVVFAGFLTVTVVLRLRQFGVLRRSLSYMAERGWLDPADLPWLTWGAYRSQARRHARSVGGREAARAVRRYQRLATELAFLHDAVMLRHPVSRGIERTHLIRAQMERLRPALHLPPPIQPLPSLRVATVPAPAASASGIPAPAPWS